jgi:hypothetical protein
MRRPDGSFCARAAVPAIVGALMPVGDNTSDELLGTAETGRLLFGEALAREG